MSTTYPFLEGESGQVAPDNVGHGLVYDVHHRARSLLTLRTKQQRK